jgi:hypothetical protein
MRLLDIAEGKACLLAAEATPAKGRLKKHEHQPVASWWTQEGRTFYGPKVSELLPGTVLCESLTPTRPTFLPYVLDGLEPAVTESSRARRPIPCLVIAGQVIDLPYYLLKHDWEDLRRLSYLWPEVFAIVKRAYEMVGLTITIDATEAETRLRDWFLWRFSTNVSVNPPTNNQNQ